MGLHRLGAEAELGRDAFARLAVDHSVEDFVLPLGELRKTLARLVELRPLLRCLDGFLQRMLDAVEQGLIVERLFDEVHRAALQGAHRHGHVAVAGDDDDRHLHLLRVEVFLQLEAAHFRHAYVQHDAARLVILERGEKVTRGFVGLDRQTDRFDQPAQRLAHPLVVIDHISNCLCDRTHTSCLANGKVKMNIMPCGLARTAHRRPPWLSKIVRLNDNPIPIPPAMVEKKALNICTIESGGTPGPVSLSETRTVRSSATDSMSRACRSPDISPLASSALCAILMMTCWTCIALMLTIAPDARSSVCTVMSARRASGRIRRTASETSLSIS